MFIFLWLIICKELNYLLPTLLPTYYHLKVVAAGRLQICAFVNIPT
jgi:hypothetical protein